MRRATLNLFALLLICGGTAHLTAAPAAADYPRDPGCCEGGGYTCCGDWCTATANGCTVGEE
ncbi:MAG TPA: hypothetical protein VF263_24095 [Longimicrobiaceae bacterium]